MECLCSRYTGHLQIKGLNHSIHHNTNTVTSILFFRKQSSEWASPLHITETIICRIHMCSLPSGYLRRWPLSQRWPQGDGWSPCG